jgi:diguanylate cyclase (GGDEF)-like protein
MARSASFLVANATFGAPFLLKHERGPPLLRMDRGFWEGGAFSAPSKRECMERASDQAALAAVLRASLPLEESLRHAAAEIRAGLEATGVSIAIDRDGSRVEAHAGKVAKRTASTIALEDGELRGTLSVSAAKPIADSGLRSYALVVTLGLAARFLEESAQIDGLTRVLNRRAFDARLEEEWQRAVRAKRPLAVAMIDVDYFKIFNDRRGHQAGDDALRRVAQAAAASLQRAGDRFARYGGEEFVFILPGAELAGAIEAAERVRAAVAALAIPHPVGKGGRVTVSVGVASTQPSSGGTSAELVSAADRELYAAKAAGRDRVAAPGYMPPAAHSSAVPQPLSALIGRDSELSAIGLALDEHRVVTLTGPVGVGKTRLALAFAEEHADRFAHVRFVDVVGTLDARDVETRVRSTFSGGEDTLFVLDGCEQMAAVCAQALASLPASARVIATSRVPLGAAGEHVVRIHLLEKAASRQLFERRAQIAGVLADPDDPTTAKLLRRLGGSPLAIELAIARLRSASAEQLLIDFGNPSDARLERPTLSSLLAQAVAALEPLEKTALAAVAAFAGSFSAEDAACVIPIEGIDGRRAGDLLAALEAGSLLDAASHGGVTRWRIIDPVREAAMETPGASAARSQATLRHLRWCRDRVAEFDRRYGTVENQEFLENVAPLSIEFQTALDRAVDDERLLPDGIELCVAAARYWFAAGRIEEARARCDAFLDLAEGQDPVVHCRLMTHAMRLAFAAADITSMERHARAAEALIGPQDRVERATVLNYLGVAAKFRGEYDVAEARFQECFDVARRVGYRRGEAVAQGGLGTIAVDVRMDFAAGAEHFRTSARVFREIADDLNAAIMTTNAADALGFGGMDAYEEARELAAAAVEEMRNYGYFAASIHTLCTRAFVEVQNGDLAIARLAMHEAFTLLEPSRAYNLAVIYVVCAQIAAAFGEDELAATLLGSADAADASKAMPTQPLERRRREPVEQQVRERLGEAAYAAAIGRGKALSDEDVATMALRFLERVDVPA